MNILAIDTATDKLSVAIASESSKWFFEADAGLRHSELVMDCIDMLMKKASLEPADLNGVVCMGGPGSFTGLRIGFSVAKGLALSLGIPFAPISTLDCMARPLSSIPGIIVPVIDAKQKAFFCSMYSGSIKLCLDMDITAEEFLAETQKLKNEKSEVSFWLTGPGSALLCEKLPNPLPDYIRPGTNLPYGNALTLLEMAGENNIFVNSADNLLSGPDYIRKSDAEIQLTKKI